MWWQKMQLHRPFWLALVFLVGFALFTRLFALGDAPAGLTWDEAALGYVGKMVIRTTRDEHLQRWPITFQSFGDYKSPLSFYIAGVSTTLFGLSSWAVRLPFALAGVVSICLMIWLSWKLFEKPWLALLSGFLMTVLPWHFLFSRIAFESGINLMFFLMLLIGWVEIHQDFQKAPWSSRLAWLMLIVGTVASLYTYHASKIVIPLTYLLLAGYELGCNRDWLRQKRIPLALSILSMGILSLPVVWDLFMGPGAQRGMQTSFLGDFSLPETLALIIQNLATHLSLNFLLWGSTTTLRHGTPDYGVFFIGHLIFFWLGITFVIGRIIQLWQLPLRKTLKQRILKFFQPASSWGKPRVQSWFWLVLLLITLFPAVIGTEIPHANRALLAIVPAVILMTLGVRELQAELKQQAFATLVGTIGLFILLQFSTFWNYYFTDYQKVASEDWLEGQEQAVQLAQKYQQEGRSIKFSSGYGQPFTFYAFYNRIPYETYRQFSIPNIDFGQVHIEDWNVYDVIFTTPYDALPFEPDLTIYRQDNQASFYVYEVE